MTAGKAGKGRGPQRTSHPGARGAKVASANVLAVQPFYRVQQQESNGRYLRSYSSRVTRNCCDFDSRVPTVCGGPQAALGSSPRSASDLLLLLSSPTPSLVTLLDFGSVPLSCTYSSTSIATHYTLLTFVPPSHSRPQLPNATLSALSPLPLPYPTVLHSTMGVARQPGEGVQWSNIAVGGVMNLFEVRSTTNPGAQQTFVATNATPPARHCPSCALISSSDTTLRLCRSPLWVSLSRSSRRRWPRSVATRWVPPSTKFGRVEECQDVRTLFSSATPASTTTSSPPPPVRFHSHHAAVAVLSGSCGVDLSTGLKLTRLVCSPFSQSTRD